MIPILPGPHDRIIEADAQGNLHFHRAGDDKLRAAALAARRAVADESRARRFSPEAMDARDIELEKAQRNTLTGAVTNALAAVERVKAMRVELTGDRDDARASARLLPNIQEAAAALAEAAAADRALSAIPGTLDAAQSAVAAAREALQRFDATAAARAADRAAAAEKRKANAGKEAAARAAAEELFRSLMAEPDPKPTHRKAK